MASHVILATLCFSLSSLFLARRRPEQATSGVGDGRSRGAAASELLVPSTSYSIPCILVVGVKGGGGFSKEAGWRGQQGDGWRAGEERRWSVGTCATTHAPPARIIVLVSLSPRRRRSSAPLSSVGDIEGVQWRTVSPGTSSTASTAVAATGSPPPLYPS